MGLGRNDAKYLNGVRNYKVLRTGISSIYYTDIKHRDNRKFCQVNPPPTRA